MDKETHSIKDGKLVMEIENPTDYIQEKILQSQELVGSLQARLQEEILTLNKWKEFSEQLK